MTRGRGTGYKETQRCMTSSYTRSISARLSAGLRQACQPLQGKEIRFEYIMQCNLCGTRIPYPGTGAYIDHESFRK